MGYVKIEISETLEYIMNQFTLVPVGGLGNRLQAICSAIAYCQEKGLSLTIIWFKDKGLNCSYEKLFYLNPTLSNIEIRNANFLDHILRDNPRRKNFWIPKFFEKLIFDKCIYYYEGFYVENIMPPYDDQLSNYHNLYMVSCGPYWMSDNMWNCILLNDEIENRVNDIMMRFKSNTIGIHIRRTDNWNTMKYSPTSLFIDAIEKEIENDNNICFFLASDSLEEKQNLKNIYGDRIITSFRETRRDSEEGILDAFVEMNVLSRTQRLYAGDSSFAYIASKLSGLDYIMVSNKENDDKE